MPELSEAAGSVWAKSPRHDPSDPSWLPLWRHLDDSAAVAGELWDQWLPAATRRLISAALPDGDADGRRLAVWLAGVHDLGKATPAFAVQVPALADRMRDRGLAMPHKIPNQDRKLARHEFAGQLLLERWLTSTHQWSRPQARPYAVVVGGHHGVPPTYPVLSQADRPSLLGLAADQQPWQLVHQELLDRAARGYGVLDRLPHWRAAPLSQPAQVLLTGLLIVADWIASDEKLFPYQYESLRLPSRLADAWDELDLPTPWQAVPATDPPAKLFASRFALPAGATVRPVQTAAVEVAETMPAAGLLVIEAPMGEGKTEAALAAVERLAARTGAGGCFVALPTRATSDAMFPRVRNWLARVPDADREAGALAVTLAHGKARFNDDFVAFKWQGQAASSVVGEDGRRDLAVHRWLAGRKKAMLSSFVIGTIDQLLFAALKSRHLALRHLGLAGKVVVIDEAHAYDVYMSQYLDRALEWLAAYQVPTIVLSATLPARRRKEMIQAYDRGRGTAPPPPRRRSWRDTSPPAPPADPYPELAGDIGYPVLAATGPAGRPMIRVAACSGRGTRMQLSRGDDDPAAVASLLRAELVDGGCALVVRNTVRRVQETAAWLRANLADDDIEVSVAHSRFLAPDRAERDQWLRDTFGSPEHVAAVSGLRPARHVVVASQVAEQSLDIDFDLLVTDLAPVDLVLQRAGRLHRHQRGMNQSGRPARLRQARCVVTGVDWSAHPPAPVPGSVRVYGRYPLLRSLAVLDPHLAGARPLRLPGDIAPLVQAAYGDEPVGPADWQEAIAQAEQQHQALRQQQEQRATTFRLAAVGGPGEAIIGWLDANVGEADDNPAGRQQVRDTPTESVEVIVLVRRADDVLITPPWLRRNGGQEVPTEQEPPERLARTVASCTLSLPAQVCRMETVVELEQRSWFPGWQDSRWLAGELVLVLDEQGEAILDSHQLRYDRRDGLVATRLSGPTPSGN